MAKGPRAASSPAPSDSGGRSPADGAPRRSSRRFDVRGDVREERGEGSRDALELQGLDEQWRVPDLPGATSEEATKLILHRTVVPSRLLLERPERREFSAPLQNGLDAYRAERADQLTLEIGSANVEAELLELRLCARGRDPDPLQPAPERADLPLVAEARHADVLHEPAQHAADRVCAPDGDKLDALALQVVAAAPCQRLERRPVARPFDEDEPADVRRKIHLPVRMFHPAGDTASPGGTALASCLRRAATAPRQPPSVRRASSPSSP